MSLNLEKGHAGENAILPLDRLRLEKGRAAPAKRQIAVRSLHQDLILP